MSTKRTGKGRGKGRGKGKGKGRAEPRAKLADLSKPSWAAKPGTSEETGSAGSQGSANGTPAGTGTDNVVSLDAKRQQREGAVKPEAKGGRKPAPPIATLVPVAEVSLTAKGPGGRPPKLTVNEETLERIRQLSALQATQEEAAAAMPVSYRTFKAFLADNEEAREAWDAGKAIGNMSVKRAQFIMAHKNPIMNIWYGKQHLGQSDKVEESVSATTVHHHVTYNAELATLRERVGLKQLPAPTPPTIDG